HGRIDDQVKIRGYRIELGVIEALIAAEPGVKAAAVAVRRDSVGGDTLVAHVAPSDPAFDPVAAKKRLADKLPPYMTPPLWRIHSELPRLTSGKIDRKRLSEMLLDVPADEARQEAPRSPTEAALLEAARAL